MKKIVLLLGMITCLIGLTACGEKKLELPGQVEGIADEQYIGVLQDFLSSLEQLIVSEELASQVAGDPAYLNAIQVWKTAQDEIGGYVRIDTGRPTEVDINDGEVLVSAYITGVTRDAKVELVFSAEYQLLSFTVNPEYSFGELMENAGLNTLLGMGTVFVILILISFIISLMKYIPKLLGAEKTEKTTQLEGSVDKTIAQIIENEELSDDSELVAVIAAAIAASEGEASADGFVVRSIKRANTNKWQRA